MRKSTNGFTIVELLVVIAIIGILSTIGILSYSQIQANTRDSQRSTKMTILAEALEKFYDNNGEYPSCVDMTKSASEVATNLGNIDPNVLKSPSATVGTNSILSNCTDELTTGTDAVAYVGDGSVACNTGQNCLEWKLQYYEEGTGDIISITSRRNTVISTSGAIVATATENGFTQIDVAWSPIDNAIDYAIERATNSAFSSGLVSVNNTSPSMSVLELTPGKTYYFRVRANALSSSGNWSATASATTLTLAPLTAIATANSTSQITIDWGAVTNADTYNVSRSLASNMSSPTVVTGLTNIFYAANGLAANTTYYFQVTAVAGGFSSYSSVMSKATLHLATPAVTVVANSTAQITASWAAISMSTSYTLEYSTSSTFTSPTAITGLTAISRAVTGLTANTTYYFRVKAVNANDISSWSTTKSVATLHLATPVATVAVNSSTQITLSWNAITYRTSYTAQRSTSSSFTSPTTVTGLTGISNAFTGLAQGTTYYFRVEALNANDTSSWSTTKSATTTISTPATPKVAASTVGATTTFSWGAASCASGTTARYQYRYTISPSGYNSGLVATAAISVAFTTSTQGQTYSVTVQAQCYTAATSSAWSATSNVAAYYRPNNNYIKTLGGSNWDYSNSLVQTSDGGYAVTGSTTSYGAGGSDMFLAKYNSAGTLSWSKTWGGAGSDSGSSLVQTSDGGYAVTGSTSTTSYGAGMLLVKYNSAGTLSWNRIWGGPGDYGDSLVQTSDGGYAVTGSTGTATYSSGGRDIFLAKYTSAGNLSWSKIWGGPGSNNDTDDMSNSLVQTSDGGYAVTGLTGCYGAGSYDMFLIKYDSAGTLSWNKTWGGTGVDEGYSLVQTSDGGYAVTGETASYGAGIYNVFLAKYTSAGTLSWSKTWGDIGDVGYSRGNSLVQTSDGGYAVTGETSSYGAGSYDILLIKYNSSGVIANCSSPMCQSPTATVTTPTAVITAPTATVITPTATVTTPTATSTVIVAP